VQGFSIGIGLNDPGYPGTVSNTTVTNNWLIGGETGSIASCIWSMFGSPASIPGQAAGMTVSGFTVTNNTVIGTQHAYIDFRGTPSGGSGSTETFTVSGAVARGNYLSSPDNRLLQDGFTSNPILGSNVGIDVSAASATAAPTASLALGALAGSVVPVTMSGTATHGALQYLINESGVAPAPGDSSWTYTPPVRWTRSGSGVTALYAWTKNSAGVISARASAQIP
jgi:hypothetical protein